MNDCFIHTVADCIAAHVFYFPTILAAQGSSTLLHHCSIVFFLYGIVDGTGVEFDCPNIDCVCRRMMATGSLPTAQPNGGIVPFSTTEALRLNVNYSVLISQICFVILSGHSACIRSKILPSRERSLQILFPCVCRVH